MKLTDKGPNQIRSRKRSSLLLLSKFDLFGRFGRHKPVWNPFGAQKNMCHGADESISTVIHLFPKAKH
jgi:hypothetical protein